MSIYLTAFDLPFWHQLNLVVLVMTLHKMHSTAALKPDSSRHDNLRLVRVSHAAQCWVIMFHCVKHELISREWGLDR